MLVMLVTLVTLVTLVKLIDDGSLLVLEAGVPTFLFLQDSILLLSCLVSSPTALLSNRVRGVDTCDSLWPNYPFCVSQ